MSILPRPVRNNNPGDLEAGEHWQGLEAQEKLTDAQRHERFAVFEGPEWGFRALVVLLTNYFKLYQLNTVGGIVNRFAPSKENNTSAYVAFVCDALGVLKDAPLKLDEPTMFKLAKAIAHYETGSWEPYWHDFELKQGLALAGYTQGAIA